jgi:hypothetical protein
MSALYNKLTSEEIAEQNEMCRKIVAEVMNFGVNQRQIVYMMNLLALQLENNVYMRELSSFIKELVPEAFLMNYGQKEQDQGLQTVEK